MALVAAPPSVLPDISPSRGEIRQRRAVCPKPALRAERSTWAKRERVLHRISPLEGEMPGRAEGGIARSVLTRGTLDNADITRQYPHYNTPIEP